MSLNDIDRISNLWKKSRGVNDIRKTSNYVNPAQTAFKENIFNNAVFSQEVPDELPGNLITSIIGTVHPESVEYLDYSFNSVGVDPGQIPGIPGPNTPQLGPYFGTRLTSVPHLTYYHRIQLFPNNNADDTQPTGVTKSTWYLPDPSDNKLSLLRDTINFKTGTQGHYVYQIWSAPAGLVAGQIATPVQEVADPYSLVFDNKNGLLYLYGDDSASNWTIGGLEEIYISFIRYEGSKGAAGGSGGITPGSDVSFNNVEITGDLTFNHNGLETGILQSESIALDSHAQFQFPKSTVIAEIRHVSQQNLEATGYFTIELNEGDPHTYTKIHFLAGVTSDKTSQGTFVYSSFIKVLNVNRKNFGAGLNNPGLEYIEIWNNSATDRIFLALNHDLLGTPNVNVRLYKNSTNLLNTFNENQWTLGKTYTLNLFSSGNPDKLLKNIYIASGPDTGLIPLYPKHPEEPFNATTEYTIIDNSMNVYGNVNITGRADIGGSLKIDTDLAVAGTSNVNNIFLNTSETLLTELYTSKIFNNSNFLSDATTISNGVWQTIAYMPLLYYLDLNVRASYAVFEVSDRSNRDSAHAFKDTLKFIVNITESGTRTASCSLSLLSSNASRNEVALPNSGVSSSETTSVTGDYGYIEKIRVLLGTVNLQVSETNSNTIERIGAMVQLYRKSNAPTATASFSALTDLRVLMYNNMKILREGQDSNGYAPFVLDSISDASYWRSGTQKYDVDFNLLQESSGHKNVHKGYQGNIIYGYTSSSFSKFSSDLIVSQDVSSNLIRGDVVRATNGEMDELDLGTGADNIKLNRRYGGTASNPTHNTNPLVISGGEGRESKINSRPDHHGQVTNRAYVQEEVIRVVPSGVSPGIVVANNDWITIARVGPFDRFGSGQVVAKNSFRGTALFELQDRSGSHHHNVKFIATFEFDQARLKVIHNSFYSANRFNDIRIKYGSTYQGAVLQFNIDTAHSFSNTGQNLYLKIWQNTNNSGWVCNENFIYVENTPNIYVPNNISGGYNSNTGIWADGTGFGTPYPNTESVNVANNHTNDNNFYERFKNGILVQGGTSNIAMSGGDLELEGGNIIMNSSLTGTGEIEMMEGDIKQTGTISFGSNNEGALSYMVEPISSTAVSNEVPEIQSLIHYNKFMGGDYIVSNNVINLSWGTSIYEDKNLFTGTYDTITTGVTNVTANTSEELDVDVDGDGAFSGSVNLEHDHSFTYQKDGHKISRFVSNGIATGIGDWDFTNVNNPQNINISNSGEALADGKLGWDRIDQGPYNVNNPNPFSQNAQIPNVAEASWIGSSTNVPGAGGTFLRFTSHEQAYSDVMFPRTIVKWKNDSIYYPNSDGYCNNNRSSMSAFYDSWHHMPQKNMSGYILGATYMGGLPTFRSGATSLGVTNNEIKIKFCLIGTRFTTGSATRAPIFELTEFAEIDGNSSGVNYGPQNTATDGKFFKFSPNNGNGELENAIFIGKDGSYTPADIGLGIPENGHPGQGIVDQRFDALGIRVKVEMRGARYPSSGNPQRAAIDLYFAKANKITFHFLPLIKK